MLRMVVFCLTLALPGIFGLYAVASVAWAATLEEAFARLIALAPTKGYPNIPLGQLCDQFGLRKSHDGRCAGTQFRGAAPDYIPSFNVFTEPGSGAVWVVLINHRGNVADAYLTAADAKFRKAVHGQRPSKTVEWTWTPVSTDPFEGAGLWVDAVRHQGNQSRAIEEVDEVDRIVACLLHHGARWIDSNGVARPLTADDVLVVAPYNAQVALLEERLEPKGVHAGTVDRFKDKEDLSSSIR